MVAVNMLHSEKKRIATSGTAFSPKVRVKDRHTKAAKPLNQKANINFKMVTWTSISPTIVNECIDVAVTLPRLMDTRVTKSKTRAPLIRLALTRRSFINLSEKRRSKPIKPQKIKLRPKKGKSDPINIQ